MGKMKFSQKEKFTRITPIEAFAVGFCWRGGGGLREVKIFHP